MKIKHLLTTALAAVAAVAAPAAHAAFSYNSGDLFLGLHQVGNTANDFALDIGAAGTYRDTTSNITLSLANLNTTLSGIFGTGWNTDTTVKWSIFGTTQNTANNGDAIRVLYVTEPIGADLPTSATSQNSPATAIRSLETYYQSLTESAVTNGSVGSPGNANSVTTRVAASFGSSNLSPLEDSVTSNLELYRLPQTTNQTLVHDLGTFSLTGNTLTFTTTAVPEPSSYAFLFLGTLGFTIVAVRYFRKVQA